MNLNLFLGSFFLQNFAFFPHPTFESADAKIIYDKYDQMIALIGQYKVETYASWTSRVDEDCQINLSQPLIVRNSETNLISVNFDKRLQAVLREVKYLKFMNEETIPESAAQVRILSMAIFFLNTSFSAL